MLLECHQQMATIQRVYGQQQQKREMEAEKKKKKKVIK